MLTIFSLLCLACAAIHQTSTAPTSSEDRQRFLELYANQPGFGYLKRIAHQAERKTGIQRKKTSAARESPALRKRVQELQAHGVNSTHQPDSIQHENEPLSDFLYQVFKQNDEMK
ncbi:hypothetical protein AAVH_28947 [Aphelenchoides avenae]|nr:hypothetical protein AAVH_28947 [Aphelenchus avenae]